MSRNGLAKGANSGHITQAIERKPKPSHRKGVSREYILYTTRKCLSLVFHPSLKTRMCPFSLINNLVSPRNCLDETFSFNHHHHLTFLLLKINPTLTVPQQTHRSLQRHCTWGSRTRTLWTPYSRYDQNRRIICWQARLQIRQEETW